CGRQEDRGARSRPARVCPWEGQAQGLFLEDPGVRTPGLPKDSLHDPSVKAENPANPTRKRTHSRATFLLVSSSTATDSGPLNLSVRPLGSWHRTRCLTERWMS